MLRGEPSGDLNGGVLRSDLDPQTIVRDKQDTMIDRRLVTGTAAEFRRAMGALYDRLPYKHPFLAILRPLRLPHSIYKHLHFSGECDVVTSGKPFRIILYGDEIENELFWEGLPGRRERVSMSLWIRLCQSARTILDIGANTGVYSLVAAAVNPSAHIYGFEPLRHLFERYERNCQVNGFDIRPFHTAVSNRTGFGMMRGCVLGGIGQGDGELVPTSRLDVLMRFNGIDGIDLAKVDVEGHEPEVLEGMGQFLEKCRPTLLIEVLSDSAGERLERLLGNLGYLYFDLDEVGAPQRRLHIRKSSHWNYLVCQPATAEALSFG